MQQLTHEQLVGSIEQLIDGGEGDPGSSTWDCTGRRPYPGGRRFGYIDTA